MFLSAGINNTQAQILSGVTRKNHREMVKKILKEIFLCYYHDLRQNKIGGPGYVFELDESELSVIKSRHGRPLRFGTRWLFGGGFLGLEFDCRDCNSISVIATRLQ